MDEYQKLPGLLLDLSYEGSHPRAIHLVLYRAYFSPSTQFEEEYYHY